jgi:CheY-like chemotaxis protein
LSLEDILNDLGCEVVARAMTIASALPIAREGTFDIAVLDVNVAGHRIDPVADALAGRGVPFLFTTGYGRSSLPERHLQSSLVAKPYVADDLQWAMLEAFRSAGAAAAST